MKLVSILIPCFNGEKYIDECLNSILNQTYKNLEVIIVNDGSTDNSYTLLQEYSALFSEYNMKYILLNQENSGAASAINNGLKYINGDYLMWMDIDDTLNPHAIDKLLSFLLTNNNIKVVRGEMVMMNQDMSKVLGYGRSKNPLNNNIFDSYVYETDSYCFSGIFLTEMKHFDLRVRNRDIYISRHGQNWQLILPITYNTKCGYVDSIVYNYRVLRYSHSHSLSTFKQKIVRMLGHKDILENVIKSIEMEKNKKNKYLIDIKIKYIRKFVNIVIEHLKLIVKKILRIKR